MYADDKRAEPEHEASQPEPEPPVIDARQLFAGHDEIWIDHDGVRYRLRITRRNRLILQK